LPVFRFNKAFNIGRKLKVFVNLQSGVMRGALPDVDGHQEQAQKLRDARQLIKEQKKTLKFRERMISRLEYKLHHKEDFHVENKLRAKEWRGAGKPEPEVLPDFAIIGAQKSGTTFLYDRLTRHPHVKRAALKELHYFDRHFDRSIEWYRSQFPLPSWNEERTFITGEATPDYLFHPHAARRAAKVVPQAQLIAVLRNPVDRAYSHYYKEVKRGSETLEFKEAVEAEEARLRGEMDKMLEDERYISFNYEHFSYLSRGIYVDQLLRWSEFYSKEQMLVLKSEDLYGRTLDTLKLIQDFLHLPHWQPEPRALTKKSKRKYPQMNPAIRQQLEEYFEPHNQRLYEYLGVDLGW
jgi:Sulfotransferase domain